MWYGFTTSHFLSGLKLSFLLGLLAGAGGLFDADIHALPINWLALPVLVFGIPALWILIVSIWSTTWLLVEESVITWCLWKKWPIHSCSVDSVVEIRSGDFSA